MAYTEIKERNGKKYYYRVLSVRRGEEIGKKRIYLGVNLPDKELLEKEKGADIQLEDIYKKRRRDRVLKKLIPKIRRILIKNHVKRAGIFGSYVRGEQKKGSDIDILIEMKGRKFSLLDMVALERKLKENLGIKIDLLTYGGINHLLKERILESEVRII